ncbi:hypothetical protein J1N35_001790 [Gossypium stocksii]|uniref:Aminotransferase-like plant mobile domain-containing protein n=1 Tax=Gossypium stocksii TaxID=47602 RepID=A0A9D4ALN2_9ROSI|nr:hypothetical protein J1N35_001790 [Gossypium stocksii]
MIYIDATGFGSAALIRVFEFRDDLISVLVDWWHLNTQAFHFSYGECTITLKDVAMQLGLSVIAGSSHIANPTALYYDLLGCSLNDGTSEFMGLKFLWLKTNFETLLNYATKRAKLFVAQAYILQFVGRDKAQNTRYRRLSDTATILGAIQDAISGTSGSPSKYVPTCE